MYVFSKKFALQNTILIVVPALAGSCTLVVTLELIPSSGAMSREWDVPVQSQGKKSIFSAHKELREPSLRES